MQQYITAQLYSSNKVNTHQLVKKFLKERQLNTLQSAKGPSSSSMLDCQTYKSGSKQLNYNSAQP